MEKYLTIQRCEDKVHINMYTKEELLVMFTEDIENEYVTEYLDQVPNLDDFPSCSAVIIKGKIVVPKKVDIVTKMKIE